MKGELMILTGAWIQVLGTVIAAIGETILVKEEHAGFRLVSIGNGFEAAGNSLQAAGAEKASDGSEGERLRITGDWFQAAGNVTNVRAAELQFSGEEIEGLSLDVIGDSVQSIGAAFEAYGASIGDASFKKLLTTGNTIQSLGAALEAIGETYVLKGERALGLQITAFGSYAQAAGATIAAVALTKEHGGGEVK
ncbi:DUF6944 family repetitive protein [Bacillus sp. Marseille-Q1617]|uniref:DUF6944 family repetitive protein n=1 Tax=Bacillus sp. Marseille-Q1617 TaxID=2736887 RepID=UPI001589C30C|nr:hypothetical protein [Bacillus sp. Marseille-Q1617]